MEQLHEIAAALLALAGALYSLRLASGYRVLPYVEPISDGRDAYLAARYNGL